MYHPLSSSNNFLKRYKREVGLGEDFSIGTRVFSTDLQTNHTKIRTGFIKILETLDI